LLLDNTAFHLWINTAQSDMTGTAV